MQSRVLFIWKGRNGHRKLGHLAARALMMRGQLGTIFFDDSLHVLASFYVSI